MITVHKYPLALQAKQEVPMPLGAQLLTVQTQGHELMLWARVDDEARQVRRSIWVCGTGHPAPKEGVSSEGSFGHYIATVQQGAFVWHLFDMGEIK